MLKRFLIAIRKPIILSSGKMVLQEKDYIREEERLTNALRRRVVILRVEGTEAVVPLDSMYKKIRSFNSNTKGFKIPDTWRGGFIIPPNNGTLCECYECSSVEVVKPYAIGKTCSKCGGSLIPIEEMN